MLRWVMMLAVVMAVRAAAADAVTEAAMPLPPPVASTIGYLTVETGGVLLDPEVPRVFIQPRSRLVLLSENAREFLVLAPLASVGTVVCRIPRIARNQVLMRFEPEHGVVVFRGAIEAQTVPLALWSGEELAVLRRDEEGGTWQAMLVRDGQEIALAIPAGHPGLSFSPESAFAQFAKSQAEQGLAWWEGEWLPRVEATARRDAAQTAERRAAEAKAAMVAAAEQGIVVLRDGRVLQGILRGRDRERILFLADGQEYWLAPEDLAELSSARMLARGQLERAEALLTRGIEAVRDQDLGKAAFLANEGIAAVAQVDGGVAPEEATSAEDLRRRAKLLLEQIDDTLAATGRVIYRHAALPREEVAGHLAEGHILFRRRLWLLPEQVCTRCQGSGRNGCPTCGARGQIRQPCVVCGGTGHLTCPICDGSGSKTCPSCAGVGSFERTCRRCRGSGTIVEYRYQRPCWGYNPRIIVGDGRTIVIRGGGLGYGYGYGYGGSYPVTATCPRCHGSGRERYTCPTCRGRGEVPCPKTVTCQACKGIGYHWEMCPQCLGRKDVDCPDCTGRGFHGEPQSLSDPVSPELDAGVDGTVGDDGPDDLAEIPAGAVVPSPEQP